jgi:hypothetical protein
MATKHRVVKVRSSKPESFMVVGIDFEKSAITSTSQTMTEIEMRSYLQKSGASAKEVSDWMEQARKYPEKEGS